MPGEFSVCQFFVDGSHDYEVRYVDEETAVNTAIRIARSVGAKLGTTVRVIITDGGDCIAWEWTRERGLVFPPELAGHPALPGYAKEEG